MLRDFLLRRKRNHRRSILFTGLFVLLFLTIFVAGVFGMRPIGVIFIASLFVIGGLLMEAAFDHH